MRRFMSADPIVVTLDDSPATAALMVRDRGLKSLPVVTAGNGRHVVGYIRAETMMQAVLQRLADQPISSLAPALVEADR